MAPEDPTELNLERRLILALALSMLVLIAFSYLYQPPLPPEPPAQQELRPEGGEQLPSTVEETLPFPETSEPPPVALEPRRITIHNEDLTLVVNTAGGVVESVRMAGYASDDGEALELVRQELPPEAPRPLAVRRPEAGEVLQGVYEVLEEISSEVTAPITLTLRLRQGSLEVVKRLEVPARGYGVAVEVTAREGGRPIPYEVLLGPGIGNEDESSRDFAYPRGVFFQEGSVNRQAPDDVLEAPVLAQGPVAWAGVDSKYFAQVIWAAEGMRGVVVQAWSLPAGEETLPAAVVGARFEGFFRGVLYMGPKDSEQLKAVHPSLQNLVDYGWFALFVWPLLYCLKVIYGWVHNYGLAIILLTFVINLALAPVRYKQVVSMKKMSELQPKLKSIQDRYKRMKRDDPRRQQMNQEVMALYQQHGVNPLGGCLPLLLQMPFLFAFYRMLDTSFELRGAPFFLWIEDLSRPDPYYLTPLLMGATMMAQQKMTTTPGDPMQQRLMMLMPVVLTIVFMQVSSGLNLYFLFSNVFGMMFQLLLQRWNPELSAKKPPSKKRRGKKK